MPYRTLPIVTSAVLLITSGIDLAGADSDPSSEEQREIEHVRVTGTRLTLDSIEGVYPLTIIGQQELLDSGYEHVGDYLQDMPFMSGSPLGTTSGLRGEGGGASRGITTIELRGLGAERTLVLVNGRRFLPGGNGASGLVDLNMIPMSMVERVEILKSGASVEYGADAVAGVVNLITRTTTESLELRGSGQVSGEGDAKSYSLSATFGRELDRGSFIAGVEYSDQPSVGKGERAFSSRLLTVSGPDNDIVPDGSSAPPQGNFRTSLGRLTLIDGANGDSPDDFRPFEDSDRFNFNPFEDLLQDSERLSIFALGRYDVSDAVHLFAGGLYHQRDSNQQLAPLPFFTNRETDVAVSADNLYNPFGEELTDVRRRLVEAGPRVFSQDNEAWRVVLGGEGNIGQWYWDASLTRGRNETDQLQTGDLLDSRLRPALGPSFLDSSGTPACGTAASPVADCVPLNVFSGAGSITPEMLRYIGTDLHDSGFNEQTVVSANFSGSGPEVAAGELHLAAGYEYRDESAADYPDPETVAGNTTGSARAVTRGSFESHEFYGELGIPLLEDAKYAKALDLDFGARWVDFSNFDSQWLLEAGVHYQPVENLHLRATWSEAFRAPNVRELFGGFSQSNPIVQDPCADFSTLTEVEVQRCIDQGVPADGSFDQNGQETPQLGGGNPQLGPELSDTLSLGLTWTPSWLEGLEINLDYYDIQIDDGILALGANTILEQCLATGEPAFCERIQRDSDGAITQVNAQLQNLAMDKARGVDIDLSYSGQAWNGSWEHRLLLSYVADRDLIAFPGADPFRGAGEFDPDNFGAIPEWRGNYNLTWTGESWRFGYAAQWIGSLDESGGEIYPGTTNHIPSVLYHDVFASYALGAHSEITLGVDNITDETPPFFANADEANTDVATYQLLGTIYWLRLSMTL